ncbi:MAG: MMPL family transporter [Holophagaceae bacterium]|nr:MMPL family transporter [Holophagaceae bacterium]
MKRLLRALLRFHLRRPRSIGWIVVLLTLLLSLGVLRVERRLDLMSLLPTDHPAVRASLEAGVGRQELLFLAAEGDDEDLPAREAWAESLVETLLDRGHLPLNGMGGEGRLVPPMPVPGPKGASLWPPLLAAGSLAEGDGAVQRLVTEGLYALAPGLLGNRLEALKDPRQVQARLEASAKALQSPQPLQAKLAQFDPLDLRGLFDPKDALMAQAESTGRGLPVSLRTGYLRTKDGRFVLVPLVLDFPSGDSAATARVLAWLGAGAKGELPGHANLRDAEAALRAAPGRAFPLQVTGAHAVAAWESHRLTREILLSMALSFVLIGLVYWLGFRTLAGYGFVVVPLLVGMLWSLGLVGWVLGRMNLMAAGFGAVLLGIGDDVGILLFSRYRDERQAGRGKAASLRSALVDTGPGVVAGAVTTALAFLGAMVTPFPGLRDLGFTAGLGLLACMASTFLILPALLLSFDRGEGAFARREAAAPAPHRAAQGWKAALAVAAVVLAGLAATRVTWEEDLRRFRQSGNPALELQERLAKVLGAGLQPLAIQIPLDDAALLPKRWNAAAEVLRREGLPLPSWKEADPELRRILASETWHRRTLEAASKAGLDPVALERPLAALRDSLNAPTHVADVLQSLFPQPAVAQLPAERWTLRDWLRKPPALEPPPPVLTIPIRLNEAAQERVMGPLEAQGVRLVGNRPLFRAIKSVARSSLRDSVLMALAIVLVAIALFGRSLRFCLLALVPLAAGQIGSLGILGLVGEPLTFLSIVAIPIALGVSVDTAMNLLHRARGDAHAAARVARVNAVCAGTTLAGFGGLVFSGYRTLQGLGLACLGGVALALLVTQWLLPWLLEKWPLAKGRA